MNDPTHSWTRPSERRPATGRAVVALAAVLAAIMLGLVSLFAVPAASASSLVGARNTVGVIDVTGGQRVGLHDSVAPGQGRIRAPAYDSFVVGSCVAPETADTLFSVGGQSAAGEGSGSSLAMNWDSINAVSEKYGIDLSENEIRINKALGGVRASTASDGTITLARGAFENEETLAKTLVHEQFHVGQLASGMPYPEVYDPNSPWEVAAEDFANDWWANQ